MVRLGDLLVSLPFGLFLLLSGAFITIPGANAWSKEGHEMTCLIAQVKFNPNPQAINTIEYIFGLMQVFLLNLDRKLKSK